MVSRMRPPCNRRHRPRPYPLATLHADGSVTIIANYVPMLPYRMKRDIPARSRRYNQRRRVWIVVPPYGHRALLAFKAVFPDGLVATVAGWAA